MNKKLLKALNEQINKEMYSFYLYLAMAGYFEAEGLSGMGRWMKQQANEEMFHAMKLFDYINARGDAVVLDALAKPPAQFVSVKKVFEDSLAHERFISDSINKLYALSQTVKDPAATVFLQWYVDEQVEEEKNVSDILSKLKYIKSDSMGLIMLDKELGQRQPNAQVVAMISGVAAE